MKYSIVIPTYNHLEDCLKPCVEAILKYSNISDIDINIVANGCTDGTEAYLVEMQKKFLDLSLHGQFKYAIEREPLGYALACNVGIRMAKGDYIVLLNNDAILMEQERNHWLELLAEPFNGSEDNPSQVGISGVLAKWCSELDTSFLIFFCAMIKREVFDTIGLLSEEYGTGSSEDIDFCVRASAAGFKLKQCVEQVYNHEAGLHTSNFPIFHKGEATVLDTSLVPNFRKTYEDNLFKLKAKYNPTPIKGWQLFTPEFQQSLQWIEEQDLLIYNELVRENGYYIDPVEIYNHPVIDCGANRGLFSFLCKKLGATKIYAFDANPRIFNESLIPNLGRMDTSGIVVFNNAIADSDHKLVRIADMGTGSRLAEEGFDVETISLGTIINTWFADDYDIALKLDCEGGEYDAILTTPMETFRHVKHIYMEIHGDFHLNPNFQGKAILDCRLHEMGYKEVICNQVHFWDSWDERGNQVGLRPMNQWVVKWARK